MGDYISREEALMAVTRAKLPDATPDGVPIANGKRSVTDCVRRLKEIPAADVRPVVLCRDCRHWEYDAIFLTGGAEDDSKGIQIGTVLTAKRGRKADV